MEGFIWIGAFIVFVIVEWMTVGLTSIWLAGGALVALGMQLLGVDFVWQLIAFFVVSFGLLAVTRPLAKKYLNANRVKTNYEEVIGKEVKVTERIDAMNGTGTAVVNGQEWTARAKNSQEIIEAGSLVRVLEIQGVKLIVEKLS